ncbi:MAG TPA: hypothetical protein VF605_01710 [Allosphingosinicella sp.]|jgi:tellurite resistance protein TehA-like permease
MTTTVAPAWIAEFCNDYTPFLFSAGKLTLIAGIILGILLALVAVAALIAELRKKPAPGGAGKLVAPASASSVLDAVKGFIQALSSMPTWLALFGGGILLLWLAGNSVPDICKPPVAPAPQTQTAAPGQGQQGAAQPAPKAPAEQPRS